MNKLLILSILSFFCTGCQNAPIKKNDFVTVLYTLKKTDGTRIDESYLSCEKDKREGIPLKIKTGAGWVVKGWDEALIGMKKGEAKTVKLPPQKAFGTSHPPMGISPTDTIVLSIKILSVR